MYVTPITRAVRELERARCDFLVGHVLAPQFGAPSPVTGNIAELQIQERVGLLAL